MLKNNSMLNKQTIHTCSNEHCKKPLTILTRGIVYAEVWLLGTRSDYIYCSKNCFDKIMQITKHPPAINYLTITVDSEEKVSIFPEKWVINCSPIKMKISLVS